jgi:Regulator of chromosome condensation (RCC1) repeat
MAVGRLGGNAPAIGLAALMVLITLLPPPGAARADAPVTYAQTNVTIAGVPMLARGYIADDCLKQAYLPCRSFVTNTYRQEATAQARTLQHLAILKDRAPRPLEDPVVSQVQWEVTPSPDTWPPDGAPESSDPICQNGTKWRVDIVTDESGSGGPVQGYEVEAWVGGAGRAEAKGQMDCYKTRMQAAGVPMESGTDLMREQWADSYIDTSQNVWCVWADQEGAGEGAGAGIAFFTLKSDSTIPQWVRDKHVGCDSSTDPFPERCRQLNGQDCSQLTNEEILIATVALFLALAGKADAPEGSGVPDGARPLARPFAQVADPQHLTQFTVRVVPDPAQPETVLMDYGDGAEDTATVYPGSGVQTLTFSHVFQPGFGFAIQRAIVLETAQESDVISAEDADAIPPALIGLPNPPACTAFGSTIAAGSLAVGTDGSVWSWSSGHGTPTPVPGLHGITSVATGDLTNFAIRADGSLWGWGNNTNGQLGTGAVNYSFAAPVLVGVLGVVAAAGSKAGEGYNGVAIKADGSLWAWGGNDSGQLGAGTTTRVNAPAPARNAANVLAATTGHRHTMAVDASGNVWGTGDNLSMQLGLDQTVIGVDEPHVVLGGALPSIGAGEDHTVVLGSDGSVWNWGYKDQLGRPLSGDDAGPGPVPGLSNAVAVDAGGKYEVALLNDGTLRTWGVDDSGVIGNGNDVIIPYAAVFHSPQQVMSIGSAIAVSAGFATVLTQLSDGTVWAWGDNWDGALGTGSSARATSTPAPVHISNVALPGGCQPPGARSRQAASTPRAVAARSAHGLRGWSPTTHWRRLLERSTVPRQPARTTPAPARVRRG